ncbi:SDH family Clp fold serine proteinase [Nocardioides montaniterrae]
MPSWGDLLNELNAQAAANNGNVDVDGMRQKYLTALHEHTGRSVIAYSANMFANHPNVQINLQDMQGMMEVFRDLPGDELDLILMSPGGQAEATDRIVRYLRTKFNHIRVFVPMYAMSAATMWSMAADEIVMGKHSQLGPIDPQLTLPPGIPIPAGALIDQFETAKKECAEKPEAITAWLPTLQQYPPGLLNICENAAALSKALVSEWLQAYMFVEDEDRVEKAEEVAEWLANDKQHLSHSRAITRDELEEKGLKVVHLEDDEELQDLALSIHHATTHAFSAGAFKIIENHLGRRWVQNGGQMVVQGQPQMVIQ